MDRKLKQALVEAYRVPAPAHKAAFLKQNRRRELGRWELVAVQVRYICWWVWGSSLALFGAILWAAGQPYHTGLLCAAALTPFLALLAVAESGRARFYHMDELELACRVPRASVLLARMLALGLFHLALLGALTPALAVWGAVGTARAAGAYLLTPYLCTAALGMELTRRVRGREGLLACGGGAALVSAAGTLSVYRLPTLYQPEGLPLWGLALAASVFAAGAETIMNVNGREPQWS